MTQYELTVLINPDLESEIEKPLVKIRDSIKKAGGTIASEENWGKKKLAYTIKREDFAVYVGFDLELPASAPLTISNTLNITDEVLRYLLVKTDEKGRAALEEAKKKRDENGDTESEE
ncbi:MAG TPA: 30S ribosomal protein S6 [Candidatus Saccharimonadaceae bacterium]|nr:30S ribosomal protein S6 [Candidatus Saccharimonadaceae bacterium]